MRLIAAPFLLCLLLCFFFVHADSQPFDRRVLVTRHNVTLREADPLSPMQVGNGDFAFTADVTGLQSLGGYYYRHGIPLETRTTWSWHCFPDTAGLRFSQTLKGYDFHGRTVRYASLQNTPAGAYFRENPQPMPMGQIGLIRANGDSLRLKDVAGISQELDLWRGRIDSHYQVDGRPVWAETVADPAESAVAFTIRSSLLRTGRLKLAFRFPYAYDVSVKNKSPFLWGFPEKNRTNVLLERPGLVVLKRESDTTVYYVTISWQGKAAFGGNQAEGFFLDPTGLDSLAVVCRFDSVANRKPERFARLRTASDSAWKAYWMKGGAVDFSACTDPRAKELERRVILSQYLVKINYAGAFPPQESGLAYLSWYGKHNSEMFWWHAAQFYQWHRAALLEKGLDWYKKILPQARALAASQGFQGAKWPKMTGADGRPSPGTINPFIIWNEPAVIYLSELVYRAHPGKSVLEKYKELVFASADYLSSFAFLDTLAGRYILGPPIKSVNESTLENKTQDPSFELAYWYYGLTLAQQWRTRLGLPRDAHWEDILHRLARLTVREGKYVEIETDPDMYSRPLGHFSSDMLMALGYLPRTPMVDTAVMRRTFDAIVARNGLGSFTSWSMGKGAMAAARLGETERAVKILCNESPQMTFSQTGYVQRPKEIRSLTNPAYFPVNSSLLAAVGLMAGGWEGAPSGAAPGFPKNGKWNVRVEGMNRLP